MKSLSLSYQKSCLVGTAQLAALGDSLAVEIASVRQALGDGYQTQYAFINLLADKSMRVSVKKVVAQVNNPTVTALVVVGIGGSSLGAKALHEALYGVVSNELDIVPKIYFAETVDPDVIGRIVAIIEQERAHGGRVLLNLISKSGKTTETIANFEVLLEVFAQTLGPEKLQKSIVVTTDDGSELWSIAEQEQFMCLAIPKHVGGRFSVFSAVGLFPLALCGVDIDALCTGASDMLMRCLQTELFDNPAALRAAILYEHYTCGINIHDTFVFSVDLESVGKWYRQLMGESVGKALNRRGKEVHVGITPTVSVGSTDLHSVGQLYLGGPYDKMTTFVRVEQFESSMVIPTISAYDALVQNIQGRSLASIMEAIFDGVQRAYVNAKRPFVSLHLPEKSPYCVGQLLQMYMLEIVYLAYLLDVDPFDQPQVELYKKETREILSHG